MDGRMGLLSRGMSAEYPSSQETHLFSKTLTPLLFLHSPHNIPGERDRERERQREVYEFIDRLSYEIALIDEQSAVQSKNYLPILSQVHCSSGLESSYLCRQSTSLDNGV